MAATRRDARRGFRFCCGNAVSYGEEEEKIIPAVQLLPERGLDVTGPLPADTLFFRAGRGDFDLVVAMYHDQGHGPVKVLGLARQA